MGVGGARYHERRWHDQLSGGERSGESNLQRVKAPWLLALAQNRHPKNRYQETEDARNRDTQREGDSGAQRRGGNHYKQAPQGKKGVWVKHKGGNGGIMDVVTEAGAGTRQRAQRRAVEAGGWQVWTSPIWTTPHARRGGGEREWKRGVEMTKEY